MNQFFILALVAFATINAATLTASRDSVKAAVNDALSKKIDQNIINHVIALLDQQTGSGDAANKRVDKATVLRKLLNRREKLSKDVEETQPKLDSRVRLLLKNHEEKIAQLKKQIDSPEKLTKLDNFRLLRDGIHDGKSFKTPTMKNSEKFRQKVAAKLAKTDRKVAGSISKPEIARSFKVPAHIQLPEKFQRKLNL